jgi:hypothetical protein
VAGGALCNAQWNAPHHRNKYRQLKTVHNWGTAQYPQVIYNFRDDNAQTVSTDKTCTEFQWRNIFTTGHMARKTETSISLPHVVQIGSGAHPTYSVGNGGSFSAGKATGGVNLTIHFQLVPRSRCGSIHPLPHTSYSWRGAQLVKHRDSFAFTNRHGVPEAPWECVKCHKVSSCGLTRKNNEDPSPESKGLQIMAKFLYKQGTCTLILRR